MGVWGQDEVSDCQKMATQNRALRGEGNCDEHCTVVVAIRLRPIAATWAWWGWRGWCMGGRGGGVPQTHSPIEVLQVHRALADLEVDLISPPPHRGAGGGVPQTHSPTYLSQMHKTLADPAVDLSRSLNCSRGADPCSAISLGLENTRRRTLHAQRSEQRWLALRKGNRPAKFFSSNPTFIE